MPRPQGAFTGDISGEMLADAGASIVIVGHSERRSAYGETDALVADKVAAALRAGLEPIVCVGETLAEREAGRTLEVICSQVLGSLPDELAGHDLRRGLRARVGHRQRPDARPWSRSRRLMRPCAQAMVERLGEAGRAARPSSTAARSSPPTPPRSCAFPRLAGPWWAALPSRPTTSWPSCARRRPEAAGDPCAPKTGWC